MVEFNPESFNPGVSRIHGNDGKADLIKRLMEADPQIGKQLGTKFNALDEALEALGLKQKPEPTPENLEAKEALNDKVSSTDIKYSDAEQTITDIQAQYNDDKYFDEISVKPEENEYMINHLPTTKKVFNPDKLPEPAKTQYKEAIAAKAEIEDNNKALVEKAGVAVIQTPKQPVKEGGFVLNKDVIDKFMGKTKEPTEKQVAAREKMADKVSSTGMKYSDAKQVLDTIKAQYEKECTSMFESEQPKGSLVYVQPHKAFDPYKLPEPAKTQYFEALFAVREIEQRNSALVAQAGIDPQKQPEDPMRKNLEHYKNYM